MGISEDQSLPGEKRLVETNFWIFKDLLKLIIICSISVLLFMCCRDLYYASRKCRTVHQEGNICSSILVRQEDAKWDLILCWLAYTIQWHFGKGLKNYTLIETNGNDGSKIPITTSFWVRDDLNLSDDSKNKDIHFQNVLFE